MNIEEFVARLGAMAEEIKRQRREVITKVTFIAEAEIKKETPVLTGNLRRSENGQVLTDTQGRVGTAVEYAPYVYFGTEHMDANPFLDRGLENARVAAEPILRDAGKAIIGKVTGS